MSLHLVPLALAEMRRAKARFALLVLAVALLVFLVLFLQTLQTALLSSFVGAIRTSSAPVIVYSLDSQRSLIGGAVLPALQQRVREVDGVGRVGELGAGPFLLTTGTGTLDATLIGYSQEGLGPPTRIVEGRLPAAPGEAVASAPDAASGLAVGDTVQVAGRLPITVVGLADEAQISAGPTLFVPYDTYVAATRARNPGGTGAPLPSALAVEPAPGTSPEQVVERINAADPDLDALTRADAAAETPGVSQVQLSFTIIFGLLAVVVPFVTGLFFLIITVQKAGALTLLRALGAPARRLVAALLVQVAIVSVAGIVLGTAAYGALISVGRIGGIPVSYQGDAVKFWSVLLLAFSLLSALLAARRVLAIDPVEATTGAGLGR